MPPWLVLALWKYGVPLLIWVLRKSGAIGLAEDLAARAAVAIETLETFPEYSQTEGQKAAAELEPDTTNTNMTVGQKLEDDQAFPPQAKRGL